MRGQDPERDADQDRGQQRNQDQLQVLRGVARHRIQQAAGRARGGRRASRDLREQRVGRCLVALPPQHHARIRPDHARLVDDVGQPSQRHERAGLAPLEVEPVEPHRVVPGKETAVVLQQRQAEALDLGVGGIDVGHVDAAGGERAVGQLVLQAAHVARRQAIARREPRETVRPPQEFVREPEAKLRMPRQIAQSAQTVAPRDRAGHGQRVAIVEPDRIAEPDALGGEPVPHLGERKRARAVEDHFLNRPGIVRIRIHAPRAQRLEHDLGAAEVVAVGHPGHAVLAHRRRERFTEHPRFRERFGADRDRRRRGPCRQRQRQHERRERAHQSPRRPAASRGRWARMNSVTNGSAGRSMRSSSVPRCRIRPARIKAISPAT